MSHRGISLLGLPSAVVSSLAKAGYSTAQDVTDTPVERLAQDLRMSVAECHKLISAATRRPMSTLPSSHRPSLMSQSAASMVTISRKISTSCPPIDRLLHGGLTKGGILEISAPPGMPKESIALNLTRSFVEQGSEVIFVDTQNMTSPVRIVAALDQSKSLPPDYRKMIHYMNLHTWEQLLMFILRIPQHLKTFPKTGLVVISSISSPFLFTSNMKISERSNILSQIKDVLNTVCSGGLSVVTTSQLATKMLNADGSSGKFETGTRAVMAPTLGSGYLPSGRSHRVIIAPKTRTTGEVRLLSSPTYKPGQSGPQPKQEYNIVRGLIA